MSCPAQLRESVSHFAGRGAQTTDADGEGSPADPAPVDAQAPADPQG
ncbi:hypothetical protein [Frankia sp. Cr1]|nr:hypothetical protein [Frankia sp. Cr1]